MTIAYGLLLNLGFIGVFMLAGLLTYSVLEKLVDMIWEVIDG